MIDPLLPLITNLATKNRAYVIFIGAGFSKDAGIKSGWDILIDTLQPLYSTENNIKELTEDYYSKIEEWYLSHKKYIQLGYSGILELIYKGDIERKEHLKQFFKDARPGEAHQQLALMVANRLIRFIFTTNFDDLLEKALDDMNVDYDVIFSDDILKTTKSWDKVDSCRIYKLHGDYKKGKIRNTIIELEKLDPLISEDFQYIIDRHGLIVIGYAGRDKGVMEHFLNRKPYAYPFYWQYVNHPEVNNEYKLYYELINKYKDELKREIHFNQNNSASAFLSEIISGIETLERVIIVSKEEYNYKDYIINNNEKKIRALSIKLINKFEELYNKCCEKDNLDRHYNYKFEIFEEFIHEIEFVFYYLNDLLTYKSIEEARYFTNKVINIVINIDWSYDNEFVKFSTPYYLIMNFGAIFLKNDCEILIKDFYNFKIKLGSGDHQNLISEISYGKNGWEYIVKEKYNENYYLPKYTIISEKLLPSIVSQKEFHYIDAYITIDLIIQKLKFSWIAGSSMYGDSLEEVFFEYFESKIDSKEKASEFIKDLIDKYEHISHFGFRKGIYGLIDMIKRKYKLEEQSK